MSVSLNVPILTAESLKDTHFELKSIVIQENKFPRLI